MTPGMTAMSFSGTTVKWKSLVKNFKTVTAERLNIQSMAKLYIKIEL